MHHNTYITETRTHAHMHAEPFYGFVDFIRNNPGEPVSEETFTHSHLLWWSSIVPNLLHPSNTIDGILPVQFMLLTVFFHNLSPSFLWSTSWPLKHGYKPKKDWYS